MLELKLDIAKLRLYNLVFEDPDSISPDNLSLPINILPSPNADLSQDCSVIFNAAHDRDNAVELYFEPVSTLKCHATEKDFDATIAIYRGTLVSSQDDICIDAVCKIAYDAKRLSELRREARFYATHMVNCQGKQVPYFYGLFQHADESVACIFLQDVGDPIERIATACRASRSTRTLLLEQFIALHGQHIRHNQLYQQLHHIVWTANPLTNPEKAKPFLVDFKQAKANHKCGFHEIGKTPDDLYLEEWEPRFGKILCQEIFEICSRYLKVWIPAHWECADVSSPPSIHLKDAQTFLAHVLSEDSSGSITDIEFVEDEVKQFWALYGDWLKKYKDDWPTETYNDGRFRYTKHIEA